MIELAYELIVLVIKKSLEDLNSKQYSNNLINFSKVSTIFNEISKRELFRNVHVIGEKNGKLFIKELKKLNWENKVESLSVGVFQNESEEWCEDVIKAIGYGLKVFKRNHVQADEWMVYPFKSDLRYISRMEQVETLTLQNAYHFLLPSTSLHNLTSLHLLNSHLPCLQHLFISSPIQTLTIINKILPIPHRSLTILLQSFSSTLKELSICPPRYQIELQYIREIVYDIVPELKILRTTPSFLFSTSSSQTSTSNGIEIRLPKHLEVLEILEETWINEGDNNEIDSVKKVERVQKLIREMERLKELEVRKEWCSEEVEIVCAERAVELFVR